MIISAQPPPPKNPPCIKSEPVLNIVLCFYFCKKVNFKHAEWKMKSQRCNLISGQTFPGRLHQLEQFKMDEREQGLWDIFPQESSSQTNLMCWIKSAKVALNNILLYNCVGWAVPPGWCPKHCRNDIYGNSTRRRSSDSAEHFQWWILQ